MQFLCRNAYLGTEAKLCAVGKGRRHICIYAGGIDRCQEALRSLAVFGHDTLGVVRTVAADELKRLVKPRYRAHREFVVEPLAAEIIFRSLYEIWIGSFESVICLFIGMYFDFFCRRGGSTAQAATQAGLGLLQDSRGHCTRPHDASWR